MENNKIEVHPFKPFIPDGAQILFLGTFPPKSERWSIEFFYPNYNNDFWKIAGLLFFNNKEYFCITELKKFNLSKIIEFTTDKKIAIYDTASEVVRLKDNASDKFLNIVKQVDLYQILNQSPSIQTIVTTGEKAASVVSAITNTRLPAMGESVTFRQHNIEYTHIRMPSTSRAFPMKLEKKAEYYKKAFEQANIIF